MKNIYFGSLTHWAKILAPVVFLMGCSVSSQEPAPVACPSRLEEMPTNCRDGLESFCRYDSDGQKSVDKAGVIYKCALFHCAATHCDFWTVTEVPEQMIDPGSVNQPVYE